MSGSCPNSPLTLIPEGRVEGADRSDFILDGGRFIAAPESEQSTLIGPLSLFPDSLIEEGRDEVSDEYLNLLISSDLNRRFRLFCEELGFLLDVFAIELSEMLSMVFS